MGRDPGWWVSRSISRLPIRYTRSRLVIPRISMTIRYNPNWRLQFATLCDILCLDDFLKTDGGRSPSFVRSSCGLPPPPLFFYRNERKRINEYKHSSDNCNIDIAIKCQVLIPLLAITLYQSLALKWARMKNSCTFSYGGVYHISCCYNDNLFYHCTLTRWAAALKIIRDEEILEDFAEGSLFPLLHHAGWFLIDMRWNRNLSTLVQRNYAWLIK